MKFQNGSTRADENAAFEALRARNAELEADNRNLRQALDEFRRLSDDLHIAQEIINHSPTFLFRRPIEADAPPLVYASPNFTATGYKPDDITSGRIAFNDIVHPDDLERANRESEEYAARGLKSFTQVYRIVTRDGEVRWVEDQTSVVTDPHDGKRYHQGIVTDITSRKLAEDALRKSEEKYRRIVETAGEGFMLMDDNLVIVDVNTALCRLLGYRRQEVLGKTPLDFASPEYHDMILAHREALLTRDDLHTEGDLMARDGRRIPVVVHGSVLRNDTGQAVGHMAFVTDMTAQKKALALAGEVQRNLLPRQAPVVRGLTVAGRNLSCEEIGGDYFDFIRRTGVGAQSISLVVGDVSGHGLDAALLMTAARAFLRMRVSQPGTPGDVIRDMNCHLVSDLGRSGHFMTLFFLTVDLSRNRLEWVRAGHDPALCYDPHTDRFEKLQGPGLALGVHEAAVYRVSTRHGVRPGQVIAVGTDGIWEARDRAGNMFGKTRFQDLIRRHQERSAPELLDAILQGLSDHTRGMAVEDDVTLVIVKIDAEPHAMQEASFDI
jgi:sigma-B regulation protein RsbU (phosphoserine phosphatase)